MPRDHGITASVDGKILKLAVPLKDLGLTTTGKSHLLASSGGHIPIEGTDLKVSVNVIKPIPKADREPKA